jgi:hypothetical protein
MAHVHVGYEPVGCRNIHTADDRVEYDSNYCFCVCLGLPVWCSIRRCVHVTERAGKLSYITLKPQLGLKLMVPFYWVVWVLGLLAFAGAMMYAVPKNPGVAAPDPSQNSVVLACTVAMPLFVPALVLYRYLRRPSPRQRAIRGIVGLHLGVHSDPAGWAAEPARELADRLGFTGRSAADLLGAARRLRAAGEDADALLTARLSLALFDPVNEAREIEVGEAFTDQLLHNLSELYA